MRSALACLLLVACGTDAPGFTAHMSSDDATTHCNVVDLGNATAAQIDHLAATFTGGDGRFAIYRARRDLAPSFACSPMAQGEPLLVGHSDAEVTLPAGTAFGFEPHQQLVIEASGIGSVEVTALPSLAPAKEIAISYLGFDAPVIGPNAIAVHDAVVPNPAPNDTYLAFIGHTLAHGVGVRVTMSDDVFGDNVPVYLPTAFEWDTPAMSPVGAVLAPDRDFTIQCAYSNTGTSPATGEVCGAWAFHVAP